jgi:hypothetical protein
MLKFEDVSQEPEYKVLLDKTYISTADLRVYGINTDFNYGKDVHIYMVNVFTARISGREIIETVQLAPGKIFRIIGVKRSTSRPLFSPKVIHVVLEADLGLQKGVPLVVELKHLRNSQYFELIEAVR